jgi:hypothetical protein
VPSHFDSFVPDNQNDYNCISVISPNPLKGATQWTINGQYITIGIYHDEGRPSSQRPLISNLSWTRVGNVITIIDPNGHKLKTGFAVNVSNVNVSTMSNVIVNSVIDANTFTIKGYITGSTSGTTAIYQDNFLTNFNANNVVFRLLPSFALVPVSTIFQLFSSSAPTQQSVIRNLFNVTTNTDIKLPNVISSKINYDLPTKYITKDDLLPLQKRFNQAYDEVGTPLNLKYNQSGFTALINNVDSATKNDPYLNNIPVNGISDPYIHVYDYYGLPYNDVSRTPSTSLLNIIRDVTVTGNLNNFISNVSVNTLNDSYGNIAVGVQFNNALIIRKQILPLSLDQFNRPLKSPT